MRWKQILKRTLFLLLSIISLSAISATDVDTQTKEANLDREIRVLYQEIAKARDLLSVESLTTIPAQTTLQFLGTYPNRTGFRVRKFRVETDPTQKLRIRNSEEKSLLVEFNGSVLSKIEVLVVSEDTEIEQKIKTKISDTTPLDESLNDIQVSFFHLGSEEQFTLNQMRNDKDRAERNQFKKDFYIKLLMDFHSILLQIQSLQKTQGTQNQKNLIRQLNQSLRY